MGQAQAKDKQTSGLPPAAEPADTCTVATPDSCPDTPTTEDPPSDLPETPQTANGDMKAGTVSTEGSVTIKTPPPERKSSKLSAFSKIFKPWKWRRRKKTSEKIQKTAVDLERKISVRTSREELIKRGVLKEVDEYGQPITYHESTIPEDDDEYQYTTPEAVKESKGDADSDSYDHKHTNGSAATTPTLSPHCVDGHLPNSITGVGEEDSVAQTPPATDHTISLSPDYHQQRPLSNPVINSDQIVNYADDVQRPESMVVEPKQIRVMLPMDGKDRHIPVIQKMHTVSHQDSPGMQHLPTYLHHTPTVSASSGTPSPVLNNNIYTPTGLTYPTPTLKGHITGGHQPSFSPTTPQGPRMVEEVPMFEPDLSKKPLRSAMKGSKSKELLQRQLQQKLQEKHRQLHHAHMAGYGHNGSLSRAPPKVAPKPRFLNQVRLSDPHNKENMEYYDNIPDYDNLHSDSDEEVQYDERDRESILAAKVERQDSLARFLSQRPERRVLIERNILPLYSDHERRVERDMIGNRLTRRLSLRPTAEDLEQRNILHSKSHDEFIKEMEEKKKTLIRKLSFRPTVDELKERKIIKFNDYFEVTDANVYDRRADKPWTRLTPKDKAAIRKELNEFKSTEMDVHDESRHLTRFHRP